MASTLRIDEINKPEEFDSEKYIENYFKPMRIEQERIEEREKAARDFRDFLLFIFALIAVAREYGSVDWDYIEAQFRSEFEAVATRYARADKALQDYMDEKAEDFIDITKSKDLNDPYWTSDERATKEGCTEANSVVGLSEYQIAKEYGAVEKRWRTQRDTHVRDSHREVDGHKEKIGNFFILKKGMLLYPGDEYHCKEESAGCRCGLEYLDENGKVVKIVWTKRGEEVTKTYENSQYTNSANYDNIESNKVSSTEQRLRNVEPLTGEQIQEVNNLISLYNFPDDVIFSQVSDTSYHCTKEANDGAISFLVIGRDVYPSSGIERTVNQRISVRGCIAHELAGHWRAFLRGTSKLEYNLEEAQASIRASKFGLNLTEQDKVDLWEDAMERLRHLGLDYEDVKDVLDIWEY